MSVIQEHEYRGVQIGISWKALDGQRGYLYLDYNNSLSSSSATVTYWLSPRSREWKNINRRAALEVLAIDTERLNQKGRDAGPGEILRYDTGPAKVEMDSGECKIGIWTMSYVRNEDKLIAVSISTPKSKLVASAVVSGSTVDEQVSDALLDRLMTVPNIVEALQDKVKVGKGKEASTSKAQTGKTKQAANQTSNLGPVSSVDPALDKATRLARAVDHLKLLWQRMKTMTTLSDADFPREMTIMLGEMTDSQRDSFFILTGVFIEEVIMELMRSLVTDAAASSEDPDAAFTAFSVTEFVRIWDTLQDGHPSLGIRQAAKDCFDALAAGLNKNMSNLSHQQSDIQYALADLQLEINEQYPKTRAASATNRAQGKEPSSTINASQAGRNAMEDALDWLRTLWTRANNDLAIQEHEVGTFLEVCIQTLPEEIKATFERLEIDKSALAMAMRQEIQETRPSSTKNAGAVVKNERILNPSKALLQAVADLRSIVTASLRQGGFSKLEVPALIQSAIKTMPRSTQEYYQNLDVDMNDAAALYWDEYQREHPQKSAPGKSGKLNNKGKNKNNKAKQVQNAVQQPHQTKEETKPQSAHTSALVEGMMSAARASMNLHLDPTTSHAHAPTQLNTEMAAAAGPTGADVAPMVNACVVCLDQARFECSRCHAKYCSETCQRDDWVHHKPLCKKL